VIFILTDDQGYGDFSVHGNPILKTPELDKLHSESIRFNSFHVAPLCTPSRGELMTGMDAMKNKAFLVGKARELMRRDIPIMPEIFQQNDYQTGIFGKWHLGDTYPDRPMDRGFDKSIWIQGWGIRSEIEYDNDYYATRYLDSLTVRHTDQYCTNLWFDKAKEWMDEKIDSDQPFFTYLSLNNPHGPFHALEEDYNDYRDLVDNNATASFLGMIQNIDQNMAQLEEWLENRGIRNNTLLIFATDNGTAQGEQVFNAGMRGKKGSLYDGGHRSALFVRWPDGLPKDTHTVFDAAHGTDLLPTLADLLDLKVDDHQFSGISLKPVLKHPDAELEDRMFVIQSGQQVEPRKYHSAVIWDTWRLVGEHELYDVSSDPGQEQNVIADYPEIRDAMRAFYESWWSEVEPELNQFVPLVIGSDKENPVILSSNMWLGNNVNTQWGVANASGDPEGGPWHIYAKEGGTYKLELSRWPFHLNRELTLAGPDQSIGGMDLRTGTALPVKYGNVSLNNGDPITIAANNPNATKITMEIEIPAGEHTLQAWFTDKKKQALRGAYFVKVEKL
jgi:arylsulfatase A-like enzyme